MSLEEYARKRHFDQTPEPAPKLARPGPVRRFYVQRHHATRLHYDFRLEIGGTLKSWAVPKGPTLDPAVKHFAAMVEDHPLDYGNFEGNIPKGNYGAGSVMLWDRGTWELLGDVDAEAQLARGDLKFRLHGEKLKGEFAIVLMKGRGKGNEWLLLKKKDDEARPGWDVEAFAKSVLTARTQEEIARDLAPVEVKKTRAAKKAPAMPTGAVKAPLPESITPMASTLVKDLPSGDEWQIEIKWDGVRALCFVDQGDLRIFTRNGNRCERQYPELAVLPHYVKGAQAILDGEIAVLDERGVSRFELIQSRIMNADAGAVAHMARTRPVVLYVFDLLYLDGVDLRGVELQARRGLLEQVLQPAGPVRISGLFPNTPELVEAARQNGLEGLIAKKVTSCYEPRRSAEWLKWKLVQEQEFVICGYTPGERDFFGSLVLGVYEKGALQYSGNVGTGFDHKTIQALFERMQPLVAAKSPFPGSPKVPKGTVWLRPELVCEVKFANWTRDNVLRAPVYLGLRTDTQPKQCTREKAQAAAAVKADPLPEKKPRTRPKAAEPAVLLEPGVQEKTLDLDGQRLKFTNLDKVFYPRQGYTKRDLLNYYNAVADYLLPHLKDRPLSLKRYPNGIDHDYFFQKNTPESFPSSMRFEVIDETRYVFAETRADLLYLTNLGCIDQNPWQSRSGSLEHPDWILIDLDPQECPFEMIIEAACIVRELLAQAGLRGYPKTTGGDGLHVYIPIVPEYSYEQSKQFAEILARLAIARRPELFTTPRSVAKREKGRVYFDYLQNGEGKTIAAPYVARAYDAAPVATPLRWEEVKPGLHPKQFTIENAIGRFQQTGDLFYDVLAKPQSLTKPFAKIEKLTKTWIVK